MTLYLIGLGLGTWRNIPLSAIAILKKCDYIFVESYTSFIDLDDLVALENEIGKQIIWLDRRDIEEREVLLEYIDREVALLVPGDPLIATTHQIIAKDYFSRGGSVKIIHGQSIVCSAIGSSGLHSYKFGPVGTIVRPQKSPPDKSYVILLDNYRRGLHTLLLLEYDISDNYIMSPLEGLEIIDMLKGEYEERIPMDDTPVIIVSRLGFSDERIGAIYYGERDKAKEYSGPAVIIIPGQLHFTEKEYLREVYGLDIS